ncbi:MAG: hypothetical protein HN348_25340, partial [Proteobacteria bacterium]|nr:hypothetical protein [Pseudomonadota bacterium]
MMTILCLLLQTTLAAEPVTLELPNWTVHRTEQEQHLNIRYEKATTDCGVEFDRWYGFPPDGSAMEVKTERPVVASGKSVNMITTRVFAGQEQEVQVLFLHGSNWEVRYVFKGCSNVLAEGIAKRITVIPAEMAADISLPWTIREVRDKMKNGTNWLYKLSGTTANREPVEGTRRHEVLDINDAFMVVRQVTMDAEGKESDTADKARGWETLEFQKADMTWEVLRTQKLELEGGTFDCVVVHSRNKHTGNESSWWLVVDRPGIYARIIDHGNP